MKVTLLPQYKLNMALIISNLKPKLPNIILPVHNRLP
jgi:hypothetical protein